MSLRVLGCGVALPLLLPLLACDAPVVKSCSGAGAAVAVAPARVPPGLPWPNQPAGFRTLTDESFNALIENGWRVAQRQRTNGSGVAHADDSTAPQSPPGVVEFAYAPGFEGGSEPGAEFYDAVPPVRDGYFALWWKPSNPWENHAPSGVNKIAFVYTASGSSIVLLLFDSGSRYTMQVQPEFAGDTRRLEPNLTATPVTLGVWHLIEWHLKYGGTEVMRDGVTEWWLDGVPQGRYTDLRMPPDSGFREFQIAPTWGGVGGFKNEMDCFWYDHAHISAAP